MTRLIEQLQGRDMQGTREVELVAVVARRRAARARRAAPRCRCAASSTAHRAGRPGASTTVLDHVIRNAQDATSASGSVELLLAAEDGNARITVIDRGAGMDAEFVRQRLFRPFDRTKGPKGMGIGAYQVREYARSLGGDIDVQSTPGMGTEFCIRLPLCVKTSHDS